MHSKSLILAMLIGALVFPLASQAEADSNYSRALVAAWNSGAPLPRASAQQANLALHEAYALQTEAVKQVLAKARPAGFKAGLTTKASQQKFSAHGPVAGVLWPGLGSGAQKPVDIDLSYFRKPMLELELGYRFHTAIDKPLADVSELQLFLKEIVPVVELPDLGFDGKPSVEDIVAANVASAMYVEGRALPYRGQVVNSLRVALRQGPRVLASGEASTVMKDQWQALLWLVNQSIAQGWTIYPDQLLITGAIGPMVPVKPGAYSADFGPLGLIQLQLQ